MKQRHFVALDGEAIQGKYVLLGTSLSSKTLEDRQGIDTLEALQWLCTLGSDRIRCKQSTVYVGFYFSYDVEMLLRQIPDRKKELIFRGIKTLWQGYSIHYIKGKFIAIRKKGGTHGITIFDTKGFFVGQGGFIQVLKKMKIAVPKEIIEGKAGRSDFQWKDYQTIKEYNRIECKLLVKLMERIYDM